MVAFILRVFVFVGMIVGVFCAGVAFDPNAGPIRVVFFFPDGDGGFNGVDDVAAGRKCGIAVGGADGDADGDFSDFEMPGAVEASG